MCGLLSKDQADLLVADNCRIACGKDTIHLHRFKQDDGQVVGLAARVKVCQMLIDQVTPGVAGADNVCPASGRLSATGSLGCQHISGPLPALPDCLSLANRLRQLRRACRHLDPNDHPAKSRVLCCRRP